MDIKSQISNIELFKTLSEKKINDLEKVSNTIKLNKEETLFNIEDPINYIYFITKGLIRSFSYGKKSELYIYDLYTQNEIICPELIENHGTHSTYANAILDSEILAIELKHFDNITNNHPEINFQVAQILSNQLNFYRQRLTKYLNQNDIKKIALSLLYLSKKIPVTKNKFNEIVFHYSIRREDLVGLSFIPTAKVSPVLKELVDKKIIRMEKIGIKIAIINESELQQIATK